MKRSLNQDVCIGTTRGSNSQESRELPIAKKMKPSTSSSDIPAMSLLSLAFTSSKGRNDFQKPRLPSLNISLTSQRRSSNPIVIPCDSKVDTLLLAIPSEEKVVVSKPRNVIKHCTFPKSSPDSESQNSLLLSNDWRKVFKPLPMPPRLPKLPAGAKARSFAVQ